MNFLMVLSKEVLPTAVIVNPLDSVQEFLLVTEGSVHGLFDQQGCDMVCIFKDPHLLLEMLVALYQACCPTADFSVYTSYGCLKFIQACLQCRVAEHAWSKHHQPLWEKTRILDSAHHHLAEQEGHAHLHQTPKEHLNRSQGLDINRMPDEPHQVEPSRKSTERENRVLNRV